MGECSGQHGPFPLEAGARGAGSRDVVRGSSRLHSVPIVPQGTFIEQGASCLFLDVFLQEGVFSEHENKCCLFAKQSGPPGHFSFPFGQHSFGQLWTNSRPAWQGVREHTQGMRAIAGPLLAFSYSSSGGVQKMN